MAKAPMTAAPAPAPDDDESDGMAGGAPPDQGGDSGQDVLLTVLKNPDGSYTLVEGDEDDGSEGGTPGDNSGAGDEPEGKQFDSKGALLKGILDILNEDESSEGEPGGSEDQFQAGYAENAPAQPAAPVSQKY